MHHCANRRELAVQQRVRIQVRRRLQLPVDNLAVQVGHHHVFRAQVVVVHARRLDHHQPLLAVDARGIAKGVQYEPSLHQLKVGIEDSGTKFFQQHD